MPDFYDGGRAGHGPWVALLHGAGSNHTVWRYQARFLAHRGYAVAAFDLPGHGANPASPLGSVEELAAWVAARLPGPTTVIGHSLGGLIALALAAGHPDKVARLGLLSCGARMPVHPELQARADEGDPAAVAMIVGWSYDLSGRIGGHPDPGINATRLTSRVVASELQRLGNDLRAAGSYQNGETAAREVKAPTLVMVGAADHMVAPAAVRDLAEMISNSRLAEIESAGHFLPTEAPDQVRSALSLFLGGS